MQTPVQGRRQRLTRSLEFERSKTSWALAAYQQGPPCLVVSLQTQPVVVQQATGQTKKTKQRRCPLWFYAAEPCLRRGAGSLSASQKFFSPPDKKGLLDFFYVGLRVCDASTQRPHPVSRQSSSPGSRRVSRQSSRVSRRPVSHQSCSVDPAKYPARAARQSRRVSRQSGSPVDPAEYPARASCQWIPPSIPLSIPE